MEDHSWVSPLRPFRSSPRKFPVKLLSEGRIAAASHFSGSSRDSNRSHRAYRPTERDDKRARGLSQRRETLLQIIAILANGFQRRGFGARILRHAIPHAGHPVAGRAVAVTLPAGIGLGVPAEESLERRSDLRLATDRREDQHSLEGVYQVGEVPDVLRSADGPRDNVGHPGDTHHDHQFHAYAAQRRPANRNEQNSSNTRYIT